MTSSNVKPAGARKRLVTEARRRRIVELSLAGLSASAIGRETGWSVPWIQLVRRQEGIDGG